MGKNDERGGEERDRGGNGSNQERGQTGASTSSQALGTRPAQAAKSTGYVQAKASAPSPSGVSRVEGRVESDGAGALQTDKTGRRPSGGASASDTGEREKRERGETPQVMGRQQQLGGKRAPSIA
uniref:Uncharacterized protein n=1 Tax=Chromera velia CCMP2878 TaxID=1169474 RepID=A0A0G4GPX0_9ALVE|eukprot:Cvel_22865.t1-p1 / transcript=Cvel_22865.t1 / gene=Cvel_22865 / organism=Chromera_velia_CCMP2878 / gene_product=hypothetical protein / transcript_product=hypothetical protein / location=Cvel_scaffold2295:9503-9874(-) / protein_length=124 / sequence_SO=supercontig / SO=protein_coding / is_pseudo=false